MKRYLVIHQQDHQRNFNVLSFYQTDDLKIAEQLVEIWKEISVEDEDNSIIDTHNIDTRLR